MSRQEPLELLKTCGPTEAQMIEEILNNNGIDCTLQGETAAHVWPAVGDLDEIRIWVNREDLQAARDLVDAFFTPVGKEELQEGDAELGVEDPDKPGGFRH